MEKQTENLDLQIDTLSGDMLDNTKEYRDISQSVVSSNCKVFLMMNI